MTHPYRRQPERRSSPARLPAMLLLAFLALVGATILALEIWGGAPEQPMPHRGPQVEIPLGREDRPEVPTAQSSPEQSPATQAQAPTAEPQDQASPPEASPPSPPPEPPPHQGQTRSVPDEGFSPPAAPPQLSLPPARTGPPLKPAPDTGLVEQTPSGPLPKAGLDGREPWRVYARPFDMEDKRPRIAIVLQELGVSGAVTRAAIEGLPGAVTLAFSPYADELEQLVAQARTAGHEVLMMVPMEPTNYPVSDPGPQALMTSLTPEENTQRMHWALSRATGYVGIVSYMGSRLATSRPHVRTALAEIKSRGLLLLDSGHGSGSAFPEIAGQLALPTASNSLFVDRKVSAADIDARLSELEYIARSEGGAVAIARPYPVSLERIAAWAARVESRGFALAPVSALAEQVRAQ